MSKIVIIGDIHGRLIWNDIVDKHSDADKIIFLGDYVSTHENINSEQQLSNLEDILNYGESHKDKVVLLRGNHDVQHLGYPWSECSGFDRKVWEGMKPMKERFLRGTQWIYQEDNIIFSHAGVSKVWLETQNIPGVNFINGEPPSEKFAFNGGPWDMTGTSSTQSCIWIRPQTLIECAVEGYSQVVGHTPVTHIFNIRQQILTAPDIWCCDALEVGQYLTIDEGVFKINKI